ncbi:MAG: large subunit ribosomal protein L9 [Paracoccaceae bacterium]|jgi:large subunit ribosomal protein L9
MHVVLLERIEKLGLMGDVVNVKPGFARNYLLPQNKALRATKANMARFEAERAQLEVRNLELKGEAQAVADKLTGSTYVVIRSASDSGALYGSVTTRDVADAATEAGFKVGRAMVVMNKPIKELGLHDVTVSLHPEVSATVTLNVARSVEEAELQATGRSIAELRAEEDAEADFDIAELFDDMGSAAADDDGPIEDRDSQADEQPLV